MTLLKQSTTFLRGHFWKQDEQVLLKDIGFLVSYVATKHSKEFVSNDMFKHCGQSPNVEWTHATEFKLIHAQPKLKISGKQKPLKTHAFSVQVLAKDASKINQFSQKIYEDEHYYVTLLCSLFKKIPQAMLRQNKLIKETWVIALVGITREIMALLEPKLLAFPGVTGISVKESVFKSIRKKAPPRSKHGSKICRRN
jgi:hypothetical protein